MTPETHCSPRLTVAMIVRDAGERLETTLASVRGIADEIVIVDTGSTDGTADVARREADRFESVPWQDSFSAARNECLPLVTGDWVLWLDAGERIDEVPAQQLRNFVDESASADKVYLLFVERPIGRAERERERIGQVRLVPRSAGLCFSGRVRETLLPAVRAAGLGIDAVDCVITRDDARQEPASRRTRALRNLNLANLAAHDGPTSLAMLLVRAEALGVLERWDEAEAAYRSLLSIAPQGSSELLEAYYGLLTALDARGPAGAEGRTTSDEGEDQRGPEIGGPRVAEAAMDVCLAALEHFPLDAQLLCAMGSYLLRMGQRELAARAYETAIAHGQIDPVTWHLADLADVAVVCLSLIRVQLGDARGAERIVRDALAERPDSVRLRRRLIDLDISSGRRREALQNCRLLAADAPDRSKLPNMVRAALYVGERNFAAGRPILEELHRDGCRDPLCLRWLLVALLGEGDLREAARIAAEWATDDASNLEAAAFLRAIAEARGKGDNGTSSAQGAGSWKRVDRAAAGPVVAQTGRPFGTASAPSPDVTAR